MIDIEKQVTYWREGAAEDWAVAQELVAGGRTRHGLFFAHLALEKVLKAHICRHSKDLAPRLHNLVRLVELSGISPSEAYTDVLAEMNAFSIGGRYPDSLALAPTLTTTQRYMARAEEVFQWFVSQL